MTDAVSGLGRRLEPLMLHFCSHRLPEDSSISWPGLGQRMSLAAHGHDEQMGSEASVLCGVAHHLMSQHPCKVGLRVRGSHPSVS